jgi:tetratricopeptide (TPR) repeat protein
MMSSLSKNKQMLSICLFLAIATLMAFWQVNNCDFIYFDDQNYVTENNHVKNGITLDGTRWAFTTNQSSNWHPLTWISHMLDVQLFGLQPRWHHFTNLLFHIANTLLLFFVLHRMTQARWESAFVAALFALHPLHVESVAWVAERKDVLSTFFWMLTMGAYCLYVERPGLQRYLLVILFFALGLMSKPMLVTLPFVLLLLDYWPLQRFQQIPSDQKIGNKSAEKQKGKSKKKHAVGEEAKAATAAQWTLIRPLLREKVPLLALAVLSSIVTYGIQQKAGTVQPWPLSVRIANAFVSYSTYIGKTIWPTNSAVLYSYPLSLPIWRVFGAGLLLTAITITVIRKARRAQYLAMGWLWFVGTLVPVIGLVQAGIQARADRYTYVPLIGLFIIAAWGISDLSQKWRYRKESLIASSTAVLLCLFIVTWTQIGYWQNSISLFDHALNITDNNYAAYFNRGAIYSHFGNNMQAMGDYNKAIEIYPLYAEAYNNRGNTYLGTNNYKQAIEDYDQAIKINPNYAKAYSNRGNTYLGISNYKQAIEDYDQAIKISPDYARVYTNRGLAYSKLGNYAQAIEDLKTAARLGYKDAQNTLKSQGIGW